MTKERELIVKQIESYLQFNKNKRLTTHVHYPVFTINELKIIKDSLEALDKAENEIKELIEERIDELKSNLVKLEHELGQAEQKKELEKAMQTTCSGNSLSSLPYYSYSYVGYPNLRKGQEI